VGLPFLMSRLRVVDDHMEDVAVNEVASSYTGTGMFKDITRTRRRQEKPLRRLVRSERGVLAES